MSKVVLCVTPQARCLAQPGRAGPWVWGGGVAAEEGGEGDSVESAYGHDVIAIAPV